MTTAPLPDAHAHPVHRAVAGVVEGLAEALGLPLWTLGAAETGDVLREVFAAKAQLDALMLQLVAHGDAAGVDLPAQDAATSMAAWLRVHARIAPGEGRRLVRLARALEQHPPTREALGDGVIPVASAAVIIAAVDALPEDIPVPVREQGERTLVQEAKRFDTHEVRRLAERLELTVDPDGAEAREAEHLARLEAKAERDCYATIRHDTARGVTDITARVPLLTGVKLGRQLEALLNPARPEAIPLLNEKGIRIGAEERRGLALVELIDRIPMKALPAAGGCDPTVVLTLDLETLLGGLKPVVLDTGHRISPSLARRLAAAHGVIPAVLGTNSEVLDLGRKARLATKKQRLALCVQQHGVCAEEHCDTPITWGEAAHITAWKHGGPTNLANLVIPCRKHHRMADHPDYHLTRLGPGRIRITRRTRT